MNDNDDTDTLENSETSTDAEIITEIKKSHRMRIVEALDATCPKLRAILKEEVDPIKDKYKYLWHLKNHLKVKTLWETVANAPLPAFKAEEFALMITAPEEKDIRTLQIQVKRYLSTKDRESNILGAFEKSKLEEAVAYVKKWPNAFQVKSKTPQVTPEVTPEVMVDVQAPVVKVAEINKKVINPLNLQQSYTPGQRGRIPQWYQDLAKGTSKNTPQKITKPENKITVPKADVIVNPLDKTQTYSGGRGRKPLWLTLVEAVKSKTGTVRNPANPKEIYTYGQRGRKALFILELEAKIK